MTNWSLSSKLVLYFLSGLWIIDGLCQFQTKLLSKLFISDVIIPSFPKTGLLTNAMLDLSKIFLSQPLLFGLLIGFIQISLGILILIKKTRLFGLWSSIIWALFVWVFGENLLGFFQLNWNIFNGFPGDALIYLLLALGLIIAIDHDQVKTNILAIFLKLVWLLFFIFSAVGLLLPSFGGYNGLKTVYIMNYYGRLPGWINSFDKTYLLIINRLGSQVIGELFFLQIILGLVVFVNHKLVRSLGIAMAFVFLFFVWVIGQMAGMYFSGLMTDPNTALTMMLICFVIIFLPSQTIQSTISSLEKLLT